MCFSHYHNIVPEGLHPVGHRGSHHRDEYPTPQIYMLQGNNYVYGPRQLLYVVSSIRAWFLEIYHDMYDLWRIAIIYF